MKKWIQKVFTIILSLGFVLACNEPLVEEEFLQGDMELKSAGNKISYIVLVDDPEANQALSWMKGYEKRMEVMQKVSARILNRAGVLNGEVEFVYTTALQGFSVKIPPGQLKKLENDPSVVKIFEDQIVSLIEPMDKPEGDAIEMAAAQATPWGISRVYGGITYSGTNVVWVIDSGIDLDHPDLNVDASRSAWFVVRVTSANDDNGHGTHVAGTIAAIDDAEGVVGVAAGATVIPVKVLDRRGSGTTSGVIAGIDYVAENGDAGDVANMSLGGGYYEPLNTAVINAANKGIFFSLAAGNEGADANTKSPASANGDNIFTISAMDSNDAFAYWSNYGNPPVDYCQPGVKIYSTYKDGGYAELSGTSMAAPHMAGILLLKGKNFVTDGTVKEDPDVNDPGCYADPIAVVSLPSAQNQLPVAGFSFTADGLTVQFTDASTDNDGSIASRSWNFGGQGSSTEANPSFTFSASGTYNVTLTVTDNDGGTGTETKPVTVSETVTNQPPVADFFIVTNGLTATFDDNSTDPDGTITAWSWAYGDGGTSSAQNPTHTYAADGTYSVTLTVTDDGGATNSKTESVTVSAPVTNQPPTAGFTFSTNELTATFTDSSSDADGTITAWSWDFGDGVISTAQSPNHTYATAGTYNVTLTVTDDDGATDSETKSVTVSQTTTNQPPVVTKFDVVSTSNPAWKRVSVSWGVSDVNGDLESVVINLIDPQGTTVATAAPAVSGSSATGTNELGKKSSVSGPYTVTITVTDIAGNSDVKSLPITL